MIAASMVEGFMHAWEHGLEASVIVLTFLGVDVAKLFDRRELRREHERIQAALKAWEYRDLDVIDAEVVEE